MSFQIKNEVNSMKNNELTNKTCDLVEKIPASSNVTPIKLEDYIEQVLVGQLTAAQEASLKCLSEAGELSAMSFSADTNYRYSPEVRNKFINTACKLMRACSDLANSLAVHKGKVIDQRITVQYVNINNH